MVTVSAGISAEMFRVLADIQREDRKRGKEKLHFVRTQQGGQICK